MSLPDGLPERTLGWGILNWCTRWLVNPDSKGGVKGEPWVFKADQARFVLWLYAVDEDGEWIYRRAYRERAKGSGKSPMVAAIACAEFLGPSQFSHFDADGKAVGKPNEDAIIWLSAISRDGCRHTYKYIMGMLSGGAEEAFNLDVGSTRILVKGKADNKIIEQITASFRAHEGPQPTFVIGEETQNWVPGEHGQDLFEAIYRGLTKTNGRFVEVTNAPLPGEDSIAEGTKRTWDEIQSGDLSDGEGLLYDTFGIYVEDIYDYDQAMPALEKIYEHAPWMNLKRVFRDIKDRQVREHNARRFFFNETISPNAMFISEESWRDAKRDLKLKKSDLISLGFRIRKECCALVACRLQDQAVFLLKMWERPETLAADYEVPHSEIDREVRRVMDRYNVYNVGADRGGFWDVIDRWADDYEDDVVIEEMFIRNKQKFADSIDLFESGILSERIVHDGNEDLRRHIMNCFIYEVPQGRLIKTYTDFSRRYIVAAEAAILAVRAASEAILDGALQKPADNTVFSF